MILILIFINFESSVFNNIINRSAFIPALFITFFYSLSLSLMNETTLNALINMFALFSAVSESGKEDAIQNFSHYLHVHLGISASEEYLDLFTELLDLYGVGRSACNQP